MGKLNSITFFQSELVAFTNFTRSYITQLHNFLTYITGTICWFYLLSLPVKEYDYLQEDTKFTTII